MYCVRKVTDDLYWVGANDHRLHLFENIHPIPRGVSYNAYLLLDEHYRAPACRGKGYGEQVIRWAMEQHPECARYRLEVTGENRAARLYERMGFRYLDYKQMVIDR